MQTLDICLCSLPESMHFSHELHCYLQISSALEEELRSIQHDALSMILLPDTLS